jgi:hypothetical protein|tara:strand:- start:244 stop:525 length:282 start_codon:yes stop_codon:yes gene_type:complete
MIKSNKGINNNEKYSKALPRLSMGEGIITNKGRAIDLSSSRRYNFAKNRQGNIGYRLLEGGVDGTNRYNFIQLHFIFISLNFSFKNTTKSTKR